MQKSILSFFSKKPDLKDSDKEEEKLNDSNKR